ncbi:transposase [Mesorhizobium sp. M7A.F.Ca.ET.027.02.1.1]|uniref:transposase n=1 Tax=Mesorhizobium sp. M7A.F.Ca.ET.027.02.1.1 TaxID=2496655 RepID=UPI001678BD66|nr:transposase [Mesorhizobium sp. M7A.F.Ca.ET.027.02.1.1]
METLSVQDYVPKNHLSRLIVSLAREELDLSAISGSYTSVLGQPPFDPRMMTALLLHGYASGLYSSRRIAKAALERADFMMIVAGDPRTSARSRNSASGTCRRWPRCSCRC